MNWTLKKFDDLSPHELYAILQLRNEVFVVEQHCVFQDADNKDQSCLHFMGWLDNKLIAYTRIVPPGVAYIESSIGRVVTSPLSRRGGLGKLLMQKSLEQIVQLFGAVPVRIGAQVYLKQFYSSLGFTPAGPVYTEDGIEHIEMLK